MTFPAIGTRSGSASALSHLETTCVERGYHGPFINQAYHNEQVESAGLGDCMLCGSTVRVVSNQPSNDPDEIPVLVESASLLIVDDDEQSLRLIKRILEGAGYFNIRSTTDPFQAIDWISDQLPDLILLDIQMPKIDGFGVLTQLRELVPGNAFVPVLAITGLASQEAIRRALALGAKDLIRKPFYGDELLLRVNNLLETRLLYLVLERERGHLEQRVLERTAELELANFDSLRRLARAAEFRDDATGKHIQRVGQLSGRIAADLQLGEAESKDIRIAASLHDLGKIAIPDDILLKPGPLTPAEYAIIQTHAEIGGDLLSNGTSAVMQMAEVIARSHHERWDGAGYPRGLAAEKIPLVGRIVAVSDFFDALSSARPYREAWPEDRVLIEVEAQSGKHFDPAIVRSLLRCLRDGDADQIDPTGVPEVGLPAGAPATSF